jgi:hypothetical protein
MEAIGRKRWAIPEGYIPSESSFSDRALVSPGIPRMTPELA